MRETRGLGVMIQGEGLRVPAGIRLVVTDAEPGDRAQMRDRRLRDPSVAIPHDAEVPGPRDLVEHRRAAVYGDERRRETAAARRRKLLRDGVVIGPVDRLGALGARSSLRLALPGIAIPSLRSAKAVGSSSRRFGSTT